MSRVAKAHYFCIRKIKTNSTDFLAKGGRSMNCSLFLILFFPLSVPFPLPPPQMIFGRPDRNSLQHLLVFCLN